MARVPVSELEEAAEDLLADVDTHEYGVDPDTAVKFRKILLFKLKAKISSLIADSTDDGDDEGDADEEPE